LAVVRFRGCALRATEVFTIESHLFDEGAHAPRSADLFHPPAPVADYLVWVVFVQVVVLMSTLILFVLTTARR